MGIRKDYKYKIIKNFLNKDEIELFQKYFIIKHRSNFTDFDEKQISNTSDSSWYADPLAEALLLTKLKKVEKEVGVELNPTYAFSRVYTYLAVLEKHKDRPECEISVTVSMGSSGEEWPIFMDGEKINIDIGDAVAYAGCEVEHWREAFQGDWHAQTFLHYVDKNGPNANRIADGRNLWGTKR